MLHRYSSTSLLHSHHIVNMGAAGGWIDKNTLARVPKQVYSLRAWLIVIWASYCGGLHGFNTANINGIMSMKSFSSYYHLNHRPASEVANITGWVTSAMLLVRHLSFSLSPSIRTLTRCRDKQQESYSRVQSMNVLAASAPSRSPPFSISSEQS